MILLTTTSVFWIVLLIIIAFALNIGATVKLKRFKLIRYKYKRNYTLLVWLVPFIAALITLFFPFGPPQRKKTA